MNAYNRTYATATHITHKCEQNARRQGTAKDREKRERKTHTKDIAYIIMYNAIREHCAATAAAIAAAAAAAA